MTLSHHWLQGGGLTSAFAVQSPPPLIFTRLPSAVIPRLDRRYNLIRAGAY
jgi:hypothetical protein